MTGSDFYCEETCRSVSPPAAEDQKQKGREDRGGRPVPGGDVQGPGQSCYPMLTQLTLASKP